MMRCPKPKRLSVTANDMKINKDGRIAYHVLRLREDGSGIDFIQYDFDGKVESVTPYKEYDIPECITP